MPENRTALILAGGEGKRMKSDKPKTLSLVCGKPMLQWVIDSVIKSGINNICVVTGYKREMVESYLSELPYTVNTVFQPVRLGTGHAVMMSEDYLKRQSGDVIILSGDAPFMDSETISMSYIAHKNTDSSATIITANVDEPTGYGRIVRNESGNVLKIVEQKEASEEEKKINEVNSGAYWFKTEKLLSVLHDIQSNNTASEYYLTDAIELLLRKNEKVQAFTASSSDTVLGANNPQQLMELNEIAKSKI